MDAVNRPAHYTAGRFEAIDVIEDSLAAREGKLPVAALFSIGQALKYLLRAGLKNDAAQDLDKAAWYLARARRTVEGMCSTCTLNGDRLRCTWPQGTGVTACGTYKRKEAQP